MRIWYHWSIYFPFMCTNLLNFLFATHLYVFILRLYKWLGLWTKEKYLSWTSSDRQSLIWWKVIVFRHYYTLLFLSLLKRNHDFYHQYIYTRLLADQSYPLRSFLKRGQCTNSLPVWLLTWRKAQTSRILVSLWWRANDENSPVDGGTQS